MVGEQDNNKKNLTGYSTPYVIKREAKMTIL